MRVVVSISSLMAGLFLFGCGDSGKSSGSQPANSSSGNPVTAPADYLGAVGQAQKSVSKTASAAGLTQAIQMFEAQKGRLPKDLNELVPEFIGKIPPPPAGMKYVYNPADGSLKVAPQ
ncbi:MAG TPA: hypothetical protein VJS65_08795 [Verrucomicrobiae bacterium]|nr:hypothetical protein [Verrucomicrobiae bacterium]